MNNARYRNAFINTVNLIAITVIKKNTWDNPWDDFTLKGTIRYGQQVREIINDLASVYDYNQEKEEKTDDDGEELEEEKVIDVKEIFDEEEK